MTPLETIFKGDFDFLIRRPQNGNKTPLQIHPNLSDEAEQKQQQIHSVQIKDYQVSQAFYPIILASKYVGFCPVKIVRKNDGSIFYEFKWFSKEFLFTFLLGLGAGALLVIWILNTIFSIDWPIQVFRAAEMEHNWLNENLFKGSQLVGVLNNLIKVLLPMGAWLSLICSWGDIRSLCQFLNEWPKFIRQHDSSFSSYYTVKFSLTRVRNFACTIWLVPVLFLMFGMKPRNYLICGYPILSYLFSYAQIAIMLGTRALSYVKDFLMLETVKAGYTETLNGIKEEYGIYQKSISRDQVRGWMELVSFVREQTCRLESHISCQNLWSVFEIFTNVLLILSMAVFLFMNNALGEGLSGNFLPFSLVCTTFFICSLFWKTEIAEQITNKEEEIAEELLEMETGDDDCETRLEMKLICDVIYNDPVKIKVGNVLTLNKRLLLSFFSQLASYLVVILQFTKTS